MAEHLGSSTVRRQPDRDVITLTNENEIDGLVEAPIREALPQGPRGRVFHAVRADLSVFMVACCSVGQLAISIYGRPHPPKGRPSIT